MNDWKRRFRLGSWIVLAIAAILVGLPGVGWANGASHQEETFATQTWVQTQAAIDRTEQFGDCNEFADKECYEECLILPNGELRQEGFFSCRTSATVP